MKALKKYMPFTANAEVYTFHMTEKDIIGGVAVAVGMASYILYIWQIWRRTIRPHVFTWLIWGTLMAIGFAVQYVEKAGPGSWVLGMSAVVNMVIATAAYFYGEKNIARSDWVALIVALSAIPVWQMTNNPLWAAAIISAIDAVAFWPTFRKSWSKPHEEGALSFFTAGAQFALSIFALENMTLASVLYPATIVILNAMLVSMLLARRAALSKSTSSA